MYVYVVIAVVSALIIGFLAGFVLGFNLGLLPRIHTFMEQKTNANDFLGPPSTHHGCS